MQEQFSVQPTFEFYGTLQGRERGFGGFETASHVILEIRFGVNMVPVKPLLEHGCAKKMGSVNAMSVDVEEYFQVSGFETAVKRDDWDKYDSRVQMNMERILGLFDETNVSATFYVLGWIAERYPQLVRAIVDGGHELASHGYSHVRVVQQKPDEFRQDIIKTRKILEDVSGERVLGYRAASYSIGESNLWALDVLGEAGYLYSSSIYPIRHDLYGMPGAPRFPFRLKEGGILEIPITTLPLWNYTLPCGGGGFFRLFPYTYSKWAIKRVNRIDREPSIFYFHPWEIDPGQPRVEGISLKSKFRHYLNLGKMEGRLKRLLVDFKWDRFDRVYSIIPAEKELG